MVQKPMGLEKPEREWARAAVQVFLRDEHELELGELAADLVVDFFAEQLGPIFYNRGLYDAEIAVRKRTDDIAEAVLSLERPLKR